MNILVVNCGSSSVKTRVVDHDTGETLATAKVERVEDHEAALGHALEQVMGSMPSGTSIDGVGHRVVHGGEAFSRPVRIDDDVEGAIEDLIPLAPLHNPHNLAGIRAARTLLPQLTHVAVFDTAFHATLPARAKAYALPSELVERHHLRRYGFHGPSHQYVAKRAAGHLGVDLRDLRVITCHLGNGASICAVEYGRSVETSMGLTPLEGLVMGTRSGDLDPGILIHLMREEGLDADDLDDLLNRQSGLAGLSGVGNDLRDIEERAGNGDENCRLALHVFAHRLRKYIGAYAAVMGGVDAIVMTAGIGENSALMRHRVLQRLDFLGARFDEDLNRDAEVDNTHPVYQISNETSRVKLLVVATNEEHAIADATAKLVMDLDRVDAPKTIPIAISARHIHLTQESVEALFGEGHELTPRNPLSQPGQFACEETLNIVGPKRRIDGVRILGPTRPGNQIEISRTDEFWLGVDAPVRASGDVKNSPGITLEGPKGTLQLDDGLICAWRHIHMTPEDAEHFGVQDRDIVEVAVDSDGRDLTFGDVMVRVSPKYALEMHIDTDEANAAELKSGHPGMLVGTGGTARILRKKAR